MTAAEHGTLFRKMGSPISYLSIYHVNIKQSVNTCTESAQIGLHTAYCILRPTILSSSHPLQASCCVALPHFCTILGIRPSISSPPWQCSVPYTNICNRGVENIYCRSCSLVKSICHAKVKLISAR